MDRMLNRRTFLKTSATTLPLAAAIQRLNPATISGETTTAPAISGTAPELIHLPARLAPVDTSTLPWQQNIRRVGQSNMTEHDPAVMNIEEWADYWYSAGADIVFISVTGILAFYPSKVQFHRHGKFLNGRDFFGECVAAARKRGMRVVARMSPDLNWSDAVDAHPEWAMRDANGSVLLSDEDSRLFQTCMFTSYMDDYVPAIMREINSLYEVDCFYTNGWPPIGSLPDCHCAICSKLPPPNTTAYWRVFNDRVLELWQKYDAIAKEKKPDSFYFANLGGNVRCGPNLDRLSKTAVWFQADNQGRTFDDPAIWGCSLQGRVCSAMMDGKFSANVSAAYSTGRVRWRNASKNPAEARMWFNETLASGMALYYHFIGSEAGFGEDRRWQKLGSDYFQWAKKHDSHLKPRRSLANIGVVMGQSTQLLYPAPATAHAHDYMRETTHGIYATLVSGRASALIRRDADCFTRNMWLAEPSTRKHYHTLVESLDLWDRIFADLPHDMVRRLGYGSSREEALLKGEERLKVLHDDLHAHFDGLQAELKFPRGSLNHGIRRIATSLKGLARRR
jgi:hypothetical protein